MNAGNRHVAVDLSGTKLVIPSTSGCRNSTPIVTFDSQCMTSS